MYLVYWQLSFEEANHVINGRHFFKPVYVDWNDLGAIEILVCFFRNAEGRARCRHVGRNCVALPYNPLNAHLAKLQRLACERHTAVFRLRWLGLVARS